MLTVPTPIPHDFFLFLKADVGLGRKLMMLRTLDRLISPHGG